MEINRAIRQVINDTIAEARAICGSEGLYQCMLYNNALQHPEIGRVDREVKIKLHNGKTGSLDFVLTVGNEKYAIELKAGANSYRNSLKKAKEVDGKHGANKTGGILKDLDKLHTFNRLRNDYIHRAIQVCIEPAYMRRGFENCDIEHYSAMAKEQSIGFVYGTPEYRDNARWFSTGGDEIYDVSNESKIDIRETPNFDFNNFDWRAYFTEVATVEPKDETFAQGNLYHCLRSSGLRETQCASEVFFHFAKKPGSRAAYWLPDMAVFDKDFDGRFHLGVNRDQKRQNDFEKLESLEAVIEIKGSKSFNGGSIEDKIRLLNDDIHKLHHELRPAINAQSHLEGIRREKSIQYLMVIADASPELENYVREVQKEYSTTVNTIWAGDYVK